MWINAQPRSAAEATPAVTRYEAGHILAKLRSGDLLAQGCAHVIGIHAIRDAFGARWPLRKEVVWDMTESQLLKRVGRQAFAARLSDVEFIIVTPKMEPLASRGLALRVSRELFKHFLGDGAAGRVSVKMVTDFADQILTCRPLTDVELDAADAAGAALPMLRLVRPSTGFTGDVTEAAPNDGKLRFSTSVDPIIDLKQWAVAGHRIEPKIGHMATATQLSIQERRNLMPHDVASVDRATLKKGLERLGSSETESKRLSLILTVSFLTVSSSWALADLLAQIDPDAKAAMAHAVIWEIADFEAGVPEGRLLDSIAALSPYGRAVFARAERPLKTVLEPALGRCGLVFQPPAECRDEDDASEWLMSSSRTVARRATATVAANLPSKELLVLASSAGFTHATVRQSLTI